MTLLQTGAFFHERYRIESILGEGGFAVVYLAVETATGRRVALKLLKTSDGPSARTDRARFEREARLAGRLRSSHVPRMYDFGEDATGQMFTAFEVVQGEDLSTLLGRQPRLAPDVARDLLCQMLEALDEAHRAGLVHRDVKPENIRVAPDPKRPGMLRATLLDFGIARATDSGHPSITRTGELIGTPRYMSPEQLTAKPLTPASDIYSLGVVVFEMLAGRDALPDGSWGAQIERMAPGHVFDSAQLADVDGALLDVMHRMTTRQVERRYRSAAGILSVLRGEPEHAALPVAAVAPTAIWAGAALALAVVAAGVGFAFLQAEPAPRVPRDTARRQLGNIVRSQDSPPPDAVAPSPNTGAPDMSDSPDTAVLAPQIPPMVWGESGCGEPLGHGGVLDVGKLRTWIPKGYKPATPYPVVIGLHGDLDGSGDFVHEAHFDAVADAQGFIFVSPFDGAAPWRNLENSRAVVQESIRLVDQRACVDRDRVFLIGNREGGFAALPLSCEPWVRATVIASLGIPKAAQSLLSCSTPSPTLWFQPTRAPLVPKAGGIDCQGIERLPLTAVIESFRQRNACDGEPRVTLRKKDGVCHSYNCEPAFTLCEVEGGPVWPGQGRRAGTWEGITRVFAPNCPEIGPAPTFPMLDVAWKFFDAQPARSQQRPRDEP